MDALPGYDTWLTTPPSDDWGCCPRCGCSQEDAAYQQGPVIWSPDNVWVCPCGERYTDAEAHPDPAEMRDEMRCAEAGL